MIERDDSDETCFSVGMGGGCGVNCPVFLRGDCGEPQAIDKECIIKEHGKEEAEHIFNLYLNKL